jgi:hypothetical protein
MHLQGLEINEEQRNSGIDGDFIFVVFGECNAFAPSAEIPSDPIRFLCMLGEKVFL